MIHHSIMKKYLPIAGFVTGLLAFPASAALNAYLAETVAPAKKQGAVQVGNLRWLCQGSRCTISGPWPNPGVGACKALAQQVGAVKSYGHANKKLTAAELQQCNTGVAVGSTGPTGNPPTPSKPTPAPGASATSPIGPVPKKQSIKSPVPITGGKPAETVKPAETRRAAPAATKATESGGATGVRTAALSFTGIGRPLLGPRSAVAVRVTTPTIVFAGTGRLPPRTEIAPMHVNTAPLSFTGNGSF